MSDRLPPEVESAMRWVDSVVGSEADLVKRVLRSHITAQAEEIERLRGVVFRMSELMLMARDSLAYVRETMPQKFDGTHVIIPYTRERLAALEAAVSAGEYTVEALRSGLEVAEEAIRDE